MMEACPIPVTPMDTSSMIIPSKTCSDLHAQHLVQQSNAFARQAIATQTRAIISYRVSKLTIATGHEWLTRCCLVCEMPPENMPKTFEKHFQNIQKTVPNRPENLPKSSRKHPQIIQKTSPKHSENTPKTCRKHPKTYPKNISKHLRKHAFVYYSYI